MKFITSFSGGKDSLLALDEARRLGHEPLGLITTVDSEASLFHRLPLDIIEKQAEALRLPLTLIETKDNYEAAFEAALLGWKEKGAEACVFGDIDIEEHRAWDEARCAAVGLDALLPLWQWDRHLVVDELIQRGFRARINILNKDHLPQKYLGLDLCHRLVSEMTRAGLDPCGESGEFHTVVYDGPLFHEALTLPAATIQEASNYRWLDYTQQP